MKRKELATHLSKNLKQIRNLKAANRAIRSKIWLLDQKARPKVPEIKQKKIDGLIQAMLDRGTANWATIAHKVNLHGFRILNKRWLPMVLKQYWEERLA
jgi:hypothetical protein